MGRYLAVDLGATSGRVLAGELRDGRLRTREIHRFPNRPVERADGLRWDVAALWEATLDGLAAGVAQAGEPDGIGVTTWGVDVGIVDPGGTLLEPPAHYRSARPEAQARIERTVGREALFARTGVLPQVINTVFRLGDASARLAPPPGSTALLTPDLWTFWLSGARGAERTIAGTTGLLAAGTDEWDAEVARAAGIDPALLAPVAAPGTVAGPLRPEVAARIGVRGAVPVVRVASHDTASAVAAIPGEGHVAFVSCGTWALAGVEHDAPVLDPLALEAGLTNEAGYGGRVRLTRNLTGLWLLEQALAEWARDGLRLDLPGLLRAVAAEAPVDAFVDVGDPAFIAPGDVRARLADACRRTGQAVPATPALLAACVLQSLALAFRRTLEDCMALTGRPVDAVHVVGGGSRNAVLCALTAEACGRPVIAGPAEATGVGSLLVQAIAAGELDGLARLRAVVARSEPVVRHDPPATTRIDWAAAAARLESDPILERQRVR